MMRDAEKTVGGMIDKLKTAFIGSTDRAPARKCVPRRLFRCDPSQNPQWRSREEHNWLFRFVSNKSFCHL